MTDQAARLRQMVQDAQLGERRDESGTPTLVVGSGKGGVGKSILATLMAVDFARSGLKVLLLDADFNLGNLHILLQAQPIARLETLLHGDVAPHEIVVPVEENLHLLPNDSGGELLHALGSVDKARLYHRLTTISDRYDLVVVDAGAGIESMIRCTATGAAIPVVVTVPEPAALADAYAVIKIMHLQIRGVGVSVLVNRSESIARGQAAFDRLTTASERFLETGLNYLGAYPEDENLRKAVRDARPFWRDENTRCDELRSVVDNARSILGLEALVNTGART